MKALKLEGITINQVEIENTLEALQNAVDGYIETVPIRFIPPDKAVMIVNEEGLLRGMAPNPAASMIAGIKIVGPAIAVGVDGEEFTDLPEDVKQRIHRILTLE